MRRPARNSSDIMRKSTPTVLDEHTVLCKGCSRVIRITKTARPKRDAYDGGSSTCSHNLCDYCWDIAIEIVP